MTGILVLCEGASGGQAGSASAEVIQLAALDPRPNVRFEIKGFHDRFPKDLPDRLEDFLLVAAHVYSADGRVPRGTERDVFAAKWSRDFHFIIPVLDASFWGRPEIVEQLSRTLEFITGDRFTFEFTPRERRLPIQMRFELADMHEGSQPPDTAVCFSGGLDSLAAVIACRSAGKHPMLVSHRPQAVIDARQKELVDLLRSQDADWHYPHFSIWANRKGGKRAVEYTQRSRSFLFAVLAIVAAVQKGVSEILLSDNGIVSINLPRSGQNVGTFLSRSTHPRFLEDVQTLCRMVTEDETMCVRNTLLFKTKQEVVEIASTLNPGLIQQAVSCVHIEGRTKTHPHCGTCTQCIDRRFATIAAGMEEHDLSDYYEKDILESPLDVGEERTTAENYIRFALSLERLDTPQLFLDAYPELYDALWTADDAETWVEECWGVFQRHQAMVNGVIEAAIANRGPAIRRGEIATDSLLGMVAKGRHLEDQRDRYVDRLRLLLSAGLPLTFQTHTPVNEHEVQDAGEGVLVSAGETLDREGPQLPFATVSTKPDFSKTDASGYLFLEFKYIKDKTSRNRITKEMAASTLIYLKQGANVLFVVFDPRHAIAGDDKFGEQFESYKGVWVGIAR